MQHQNWISTSRLVSGPCIECWLLSPSPLHCCQLMLVVSLRFHNCVIITTHHKQPETYTKPLKVHKWDAMLLPDWVSWLANCTSVACYENWQFLLKAKSFQMGINKSILEEYCCQKLIFLPGNATNEWCNLWILVVWHFLSRFSHQCFHHLWQSCNAQSRDANNQYHTTKDSCKPIHAIMFPPLNDDAHNDSNKASNTSSFPCQNHWVPHKETVLQSWDQ